MSNPFTKTHYYPIPIAHQLDMFDCQTGDTGVWIDIIFVMLNFVHQGHDYGYEVKIIKIAWSLYLSFLFSSDWKARL